MSKNVLLTIEYDGTNFSGWQRQKTVRTVQGVLEEVLSKVCAMEVKLDGVSRTDAGVHALGQRATFSGDFGIPVERIQPAVNHLLAGRTAFAGENQDVRLVDVREMPEGFHARFSSTGKRYRYLIYNGKEMPVFLRNYRYQVERPLDFEAMQQAAAYIQGEHDFACFQATGSFPRKTTVREIYDISLERREAFSHREPLADLPLLPEDMVLSVSGNGFLYNMVRIITGTLVDVGLGKIKPEEIPEIIASCDRSRAGHTAPPQGLWLDEVYYEQAYGGLL